MNDLNSVLNDMADEASLNPTELTSVRRELSRIYSAMEEHYDRMLASAGGYEPTYPGAEPEYGCAPHRAFTRSVWPRDEHFAGWQRNASTDIDFDEPGVIGVDIDNGDYTARLDIMDAYFGQANARLESQRDGDMVLTVNDSRGQREFLIRDGGTGPIYKCGVGEARNFTENYPSDDVGRDRYPSGTAVWSPWTATPNSAYWFDGYRNLVVSGELDESPEFNWFIGQTISGDYVHPELRTFGEFLSDLSDRPLGGTIGAVRYTSEGRTRVLNIADPRSSPANFISAMDVIYDLATSDADYYFTFED